MNTPDPHPPGALSRWAARVGLALIVLSLAALAALTVWDRTRRWEVPRFEATRFVALVPPPAVAAPPAAQRERWLMAVNPECARCRRAFPRALARRDREAVPPRLEALIVDAETRPGPAALAPFRADAVWWDSSGVWRHAWGHRVYGEILRFAPDGTLRGVEPQPDEK